MFLQENDLNLAIDAIANDEVVGIPTETVYGLAVNPYSSKAVEKLFFLFHSLVFLNRFQSSEFF